MKKTFLISICMLSLISILGSCQNKEYSSSALNPLPLPAEFGSYWYAGTAEIAAYNLEQARYGEIHQGKAVLIFVTEPFSKTKQVKLDYPKQNPDDEQTVLKLNFTKKFNTGIYPYSMMLSAFTPVEFNQYPHTPKVTMSSQEWCGQVFSQLNLGKDNYELHSYSYFESEGDITRPLEKKLLEDEIWNKIRLNPDLLPTGNIEIVPGLFHTRLLHKTMNPQKAVAKMTVAGNLNTYTLEYPQDNRVLKIIFEHNFPFKIIEWEETVVGINGKTLTTKATLDKTLKTDYWNKNNVADSYLRDSLHLK